MQETCDTSMALHFQGCRHNKDASGNQLCSLRYPFCQNDGAQIMKWLLRQDYITSYSLDRFAAGPWNQSSLLSKEEKLIPVKAQMPKPVERFVVRRARTLNSATKKGQFTEIQSHIFSSVSLVMLGTKWFWLSVWLLAEEKNRLKKINSNWK